MKPIIVALTCLAATVAAQSSPPWYDVQSSAFRLILKSDNDTYDGHALGACHQGAAVEGLCLTGDTIDDPAVSYTTFYHNVSSSENATVNANDTLGVLNYILTIGGGINVPSAMKFSQSPGSNIADPIFSPGWDDFTPIAFDEECGSAYIPIYQDDTVSPPSYYNPTLKLKNWYICLTRFSYLYTTLVYKFGVTGEPQNPTCVAVEVVRVWV
ncbi:uncharacterized protein K460DRAFT_429333 [Cucurbitaria berberidis CBS 394.84]|uniref:DUF7907 domain-containing protein n=1 Tax=Cucurbitaria berberidis CBS 394.84 TaxID=1168544 RepID=A0A9P4GFU5_9PLEO|nr:uncharacterized protein K460DRAFT_429333 [Cucurbitaria berberidis CBS 394.84]KAF1844587.1 hypothetical protein K460DRAFT_429333 [Cucurbitaria berberidis CBS 394.84]